MAKKDPAFLFYSSDFLTGTMTMSDDQVGKYIRLLCFQHQKGEISAKDFIKISGGDPELAEKFILLENGNYKNQRLSDEIESREKFSAAQKKRKQEYWDKKNRIDTKPIPNLNQTDTEFKPNKVIPYEDEDVNENVNEDENRKGGAGEKQKYPLEKINEMWIEAGLIHTGSETQELRQVAEKILKVKDIGRLTPENEIELEMVFKKIIHYLKQDNNVTYYGSFKSLNNNLDKVLNAIKNGKSKGKQDRVYSPEDFS